VVKEREPGKRAEFYRVSEGDVCGMMVAAWIPVLKQWESMVESAAVELGANGGGDRLAEATEFIAFLRCETEGILERWAEYRRDPE